MESSALMLSIASGPLYHNPRGWRQARVRRLCRSKQEGVHNRFIKTRKSLSPATGAHRLDGPEFPPPTDVRARRPRLIALPYVTIRTVCAANTIAACRGAFSSSTHYSGAAFACSLVSDLHPRCRHIPDLMAEARFGETLGIDKGDLGSRNFVLSAHRSV
jgi:hypothetical protein